VRQDS